MQAFRSGFITILGSPNVGKSTLVNRMVGNKVSIVSNRPQTTRNVIHGVVTGKDFQIVFLDTPGLHRPKNKLGEYMMKSANQSAKDVDAVLFLVDLRQGVKERDAQNLRVLAADSIPLVVALNKADQYANREAEVREQLKNLGIARKIFAISALTGEGVDTLLEHLKSYLVEGPQYYPDDMYTDQPERFIAAEMIREKAMALLREELPYGIGVEIEKIEQNPEKNVTVVQAVLYCEKKSHKGIVIGKGGVMLKKIGSEARADLEMLFGQRVYLELCVKVKEDWRNSNAMLKTLGYE